MWWSCIWVLQAPSPGMTVVLQHEELVSKVGKDFVGRVVSVTGEPLDGKGPIAADDVWPVFNTAPPIYQRRLLEDQLESGVTAIDCAIPYSARPAHGPARRQQIRQKYPADPADHQPEEHRPDSGLLPDRQTSQRYRHPADPTAGQRRPGKGHSSGIDHVRVADNELHSALRGLRHGRIPVAEMRPGHHHHLRRPDQPCPCLPRSRLAVRRQPWPRFLPGRYVLCPFFAAGARRPP